MSFQLSQKSKERLRGVNVDLISIVEKALKLTSVDFAITQGLRTKEQQSQFVKEGKSQTMNSRHLTGHAVDVVACVGEGISWEWKYYEEISKAFKKASADLDIPIIWGGDWRTLKDGCHFELDRRVYP